MNEWTVVVVVIALTGLVLTVVRPIVALNTSITKLTEAVGTLKEGVKDLTSKNDNCHTEMTNKIANHETRITVIEDWREGAK